jgi:hypothetical protein
VVSDYINVVPIVIAAANGFIALVVGQFFKERPTARVILVVMAGALTLTAIGATIYGQSQVLAKRAAEEDHRRGIREAFGAFIGRGREIEKQIADTSKQSPIQDQNIWDSEVTSYVNANLGQSYSTRFRDQTGIAPAYLNSGVDADRQRLWWELHVRLFRLEQFSDQFPY